MVEQTNVVQPRPRRPAAWPKVLGLGVALAMLLTPGLGMSVGHGQWLETKITLPDSLGGATDPTCLTTDTSERLVYVGDASGAVYVVDVETRTRVAKLPCGYVYGICTSTRQNKVYAADNFGNQVSVILCATNQVVATVPTGAKPLALCYNSIDDKVYSASYDGGDLTVIDCSSDNAIATMHLGKNPASLCYNPASNRVFCVSESLWESVELTVIDGASDSVVAAYAGPWYGSMVVNGIANRVYVGSWGSGILALDGTTGAVLDTLRAGADVMCINSRTQKLYSACNHPVEVSVFDCTADTLVKRFQLRGDSYINSIACDTATGKVYASCEWNGNDELVVIGGDSDTIIKQLCGPYQYGLQRGLLASSRRGRVYAVDRRGLELAVFDTFTDSLLRTIMIGGGSTLMCYDSADDKAYYVSYSVLGEAGAIDPATNQPVGHVQVGPYPQDVVWHAPTNRVYCSGGYITVVDPTADTVTKIVPLRSGLMCSAPRLNKVYVCGEGGVSVVDCGYDSIVKTIPIPTIDAWSMCYVAYDKLYIGGYGGVSIIDCIGDSLIRSYPFNFSRLAAGREGKRVYCWRPYSLCTFDPAGDTLVADVPWVATGGMDLLYVTGANKVYCACATENYILVADASTDSVIGEIPLYVAWALGYDSVTGLVYCSQGLDSAVTFVDSRTDSVVASLDMGIFAEEFIMVPARNRVYVGGSGNSFIPVIRTDPPDVEEAVRSPASEKSAVPTIVSGSTPLAIHQPSVLLDAVGRKVLDVRPGPHSLGGCRAGVYFLRNCTSGKVVKILLAD